MSTTSELPQTNPVQLELSNDISSDGLDAHTRQRINARVRACRLPPELLIEIFFRAQKIWRSQRHQDAQDFSSRFESGWMTVLHVCTAWRRMALLAPMLWKDVNILDVHYDYAHDILARSADLKLRLVYKESYLDSTRELLEEHLILSRNIWFDVPVLRRVEMMEIICSGRDKHLLNLLLHEALNIQTFCLQSYSQILLPLNMLGPAFPQLCQLGLGCCSVSPNSPLFARTLTHLKLGMVDFDRGFSSVVQVLSVLSVLSGLEYLHLSFSSLRDSTRVQLKIASLSSLQYMSLSMRHDTEPLAAHATLLRHLSVPPTTDMIVGANFGMNWDGPLCQQIFSSVFVDRPYLELDLAGKAQWSFYQWNPNTRVRTDGRRMHVSAYYNENDDEGSLELRELIVSARPQSLVIWSDFWEAMFAETYDVALWDGISAAKDVRCLTICYRDHKHLWFALSRKYLLLFPCLETIVLSNVHCTWSENKREGDAEFKFGREHADVRVCSVDAAILSEMILDLIWHIKLMLHVGLSVREVMIEGTLAEWDGWDNARAMLGDLGLTLTT